MSSEQKGGLIASGPVAWVSSGRHLVIPFGQILRVYEVTSAEPKCLSSLQGHTAAVVAVVPSGNMRVASASKDGTVRVWDVDDGSCLRTIDVGQQIRHICKVGNEKLICFCINKVVMVSLSRKEKTKMRRVFADCKFNAGGGRIASSTDGSLVAVVHKSLLELTSVVGPASPVVIIKHFAWLTSVSISEDGSMLAVGDEKGAIFVYPNAKAMFPASNRTVRLDRSQTTSAPMHWHSSAIRSLTFSSDAMLLLSGGSESALVSWKMTRNRFGDRTILPRLKAPLLGISISPDESKYALTHSDNSVRVIDQAGSLVYATIRGISASLDQDETGTSRGVLSSRVSFDFTRSLNVTGYAGRPGHVLISGSGIDVQIYDVYNSRHVSDINVIPRNLVCEDRKPCGKHKEANMARVTMVKNSASTSKMVTVDVQNLRMDSAGGFGIEEKVTTLRFWDSRKIKDKFSLSAVFVNPHGVKSGILDVCFHPWLPVVATASPEGTFKIWREVTTSSKNSKGASWRCEVELDYKGLPCNSLCFSEDGSLLAVACGSVLTVWLVEDLFSTPGSAISDSNQGTSPDFLSPSSLRAELLHVLVHPPSEEPIQSVSFLHRNVPLFVAATEAGVYVWNALTQGIWWSSRIRTDPKSLVSDRSSGRFALAVQIPALTFSDRTAFADHDNGELGIGRDGASATGSQALGSNLEPQDINGEKTDSRRLRKLTKRDRPNAAKLLGHDGAKNESIEMEYCPTETAIALFDVVSPVPVNIARFSTVEHVAAMDFIQQPGSGDSLAPLVCINSNLDICLHFTSEGSNRASNGASVGTSPAMSGRSMECLAVDQRKIDSLLGKAVLKVENHADDPLSHLEHPDGTNQDIEVSRLGQDGHGGTDQVFQTFFDGPIHVQAPVSSKSVDFIRSLLPGQRDVIGFKSRDVESNRDEPLPVSSHENVVKLNSESEHQLWTVSEYKACREVCAKLMRTYSSKT